MTFHFLLRSIVNRPAEESSINADPAKTIFDEIVIALPRPSQFSLARFLAPICEYFILLALVIATVLTVTCSKSTAKTQEKGEKYVQSLQ